MALTRRACLFPEFALGSRAMVGAALAAACIGVLAPLPARSGEPQPIDSSRIVSIGGAVTETIYALGLEGRNRRRGHDEPLPAGSAEARPNVGYMRALSAEGILSLKPSWVIAIDGSGPPAALKLVSDAGVPLTMIHDDPSAGRESPSRSKQSGNCWERRRRRSRSPMRRALVLRWSSICVRGRRNLRACFSSCRCRMVVPMVGGRGTAADAMIRLAGGANAADAIEGYKPMTDEGVIAAALDVILKMNNGNMVGGKGDIFALPAFSVTPAAAKRALIGMDGLYLLGFGPRTPDAVRDLMRTSIRLSRCRRCRRSPTGSERLTRRDPRRD